jgi:hypothetical protein
MKVSSITSDPGWSVGALIGFRVAARKKHPIAHRHVNPGLPDHSRRHTKSAVVLENIHRRQSLLHVAKWCGVTLLCGLFYGADSISASMESNGRMSGE